MATSILNLREKYSNRGSWNVSQRIVNWYIEHPDVFKQLDYKTDYDQLLSVLNRSDVRRIIYNMPISNIPKSLIKPNSKSIIPKPKVEIPNSNTDAIEIPPDKSKFKLYQSTIHKLTRKQDLKSLDRIDLWENFKPSPKHRWQFRSKTHYCIDHKISIYWGFVNNIPVEHIADISNLRIISAYDNAMKNTKNFIDDDNRWIIES